MPCCQVPGVPFIPVLSILLNVYLMASLDAQTWAKFLGWMVIGKQSLNHKYLKSYSIIYPQDY